MLRKPSDSELKKALGEGKPTLAGLNGPSGNGHWQTENGFYTRVSNALLEAFAELPLSGVQARILFWVLRNSYGYSRKDTEPASFAEVGKRLGLAKSSTHHAFMKLQAANILFCKDGRWGINKDAWTWVGDNLVDKSRKTSPGVQSIGRNRPTHWTKSSNPLDGS